MLAQAAKVAKGIPREPAERRGKIPALRRDRATGTRQIQPGPRRRKLLSNLRPPLRIPEVRLPRAADVIIVLSDQPNGQNDVGQVFVRVLCHRTISSPWRSLLI